MVCLLPLLQNPSGICRGQAEFTGYWASDIRSKLMHELHGVVSLYAETNDHFGSAQDLKDLSAALHARGMYLMVDVVCPSVNKEYAS